MHFFIPGQNGGIYRGKARRLVAWSKQNILALSKSNTLVWREFFQNSNFITNIKILSL